METTTTFTQQELAVIWYQLAHSNVTLSSELDEIRKDLMDKVYALID